MNHLIPSQGQTPTIPWGTKPKAIGVHTSRTIMSNELSIIFSKISSENAVFEDYKTFVLERNGLALHTQSNREITWKNLVQLYGFTDTPLFRNFKRLWPRLQEQERPVLALVYAASRDSILRSTIPLVRDMPIRTLVNSRLFLDHIEQTFPDRYSKATARSTSQALFSSWTHAHWLGGENQVERPRRTAPVGAGSLALALFIAWTEGKRGDQLFGTEIVELLLKEVGEPKALLWEAHRNSFLNYYDSGGISDIRFPGWLTTAEEEKLHGTL